MKNDGRFKKGQHWRQQKPWWNKKWLVREYNVLKKSAATIAAEGEVTENAILFWLKKHQIKTRTMSQVRKLKKWGAIGADNPMWNRLGELNPNWKGGITPERQAFYMSPEWKKACSTTWRRDKATCQRCGANKKNSPDLPMAIHHIQPFSNVPLRADPSNLVLVCEVCHHFIHSRANTAREYLPKI